jgi:hypothetical protein
MRVKYDGVWYWYRKTILENQNMLNFPVLNLGSSLILARRGVWTKREDLQTVLIIKRQQRLCLVPRYIVYMHDPVLAFIPSF